MWLLGFIIHSAHKGTARFWLIGVEKARLEKKEVVKAKSML